MTPAGKPTLSERLAAVSAGVQRLSYDGQMGGRESYKYTSINAIADLARPLLAEHGVALVPGAVKVLQHDEVTSKGGAKGYHVVIRRSWTVMAEHEYFSMQSIGGSIDYSDKAYNKAHTFARKNLLMDLLNLSTGDDPDAEAPEAGHRERRAPPVEAQTSKPVPQPPPAVVYPNYEEILATGKADGLSVKQIREILKNVGITKASELEDTAIFKIGMDAVTGYIGGPEPKGELPVEEPNYTDGAGRVNVVPTAGGDSPPNKPSDVIAKRKTAAK